MPAIWLLADLIAMVYKKKYAADVGNPMKPDEHLAGEFKRLREECFPAARGNQAAPTPTGPQRQKSRSPVASKSVANAFTSLKRSSP